MSSGSALQWASCCSASRMTCSSGSNGSLRPNRAASAGKYGSGTFCKGGARDIARHLGAIDGGARGLPKQRIIQCEVGPAGLRPAQRLGERLGIGGEVGRHETRLFGGHHFEHDRRGGRAPPPHRSGRHGGRGCHALRRGSRHRRPRFLCATSPAVATASAVAATGSIKATSAGRAPLTVTSNRRIAPGSVRKRDLRNGRTGIGPRRSRPKHVPRYRRAPWTARPRAVASRGSRRRGPR